MRKRFWFLAAVLMCAVLALSVSAAVEGDYTYVIKKGKANITATSSSISGDVVIPETLGGYPVSAIQTDAFANRDNITSITIPDGITIADCAIYDCSKLTAITVSETNAGYATVDGVLFNKTKTALIAYPAGKTDTAYTIPDGVTKVYAYSFYNCSKLNKVTIPEGVKSIPAYMFYNCYNLKTVSLPDGITSIGDHAFWFCNSLTDINLPDGLLSIGSHAFYWCNSLTDITLPDGLLSIGNHAFHFCTALTAITLPDGLLSIGDYAFSFCRSMTTAVIPYSVTSIGTSAFSSCPNLIICGCTGSAAESYANSSSIHFSALDEAAVPQFTANPEDADCAPGTAVILSVTASADDNGTLSYQWYVSDTPDGDGTAIDGASDASYTPPTDTAGENYYYVIVTNTITTAIGEKTASARSNTAKVTVSVPLYTISGSLVTYGSAADVTIELLLDGKVILTEIIPNSTGADTYTISDVEAGDYTLRISKENHVPRTYAVSIQ